ncbi:MAG: hypothetical protein QM726_08475 [Chitinophagaceae bacterium]
MENEQAVTGQSFFYLEICCRLVAEKFGKLPISSWTNSDYMRLSGILTRNTSITLSPSTLKRIFGKLKTPERYYPQKATRDALASYAGYKTWEELVAHYRPAEEPASTIHEKQETAATNDVAVSAVNTAPTLQQPGRQSKSSNRIILFTCLLMIPSILILYKYVWQRPTLPDATNITFSCLNPEGETPHTANFVCRLQAGVDETKSWSVDYGDGRRLEALGGRQAFSHYYETPGRFYSILKYGSTPIDTAVIYLRTSGWSATGTMPRDTTRVYPIETSLLTGKSATLGADIMQILHSGIDTSNTFFIGFDNIMPTNIDGDNFELSTNVITSAQRPGVRCSQVGIVVYGEQSKHSFRIIRPGCEQWLHLRLSEQYNEGSEPNLSFLDADLSKGGNIKFTVLNKKASIYINDKLVYTGNYSFPLKKVYGVSIVFSGVGAIRSFYLRDNKTHETFPGSFAATDQTARR